MFANVIVDISHEKLDRTFQYKIPEHLESCVIPGVQVEIPFGKGNTLRTGYVLEVTEKAEFPIEKMKAIDKIVQGSIAIESHLIQLAWWIKENYASTMNQALKTVIPIKKQVKAKEKKQIRLLLNNDAYVSAIAEAEKKHAIARLRVLTAFAQENVLPYEMVTRKLNISLSTLQTMEKLHMIAIERENIYRNPVIKESKNVKPVTLNETQTQVVYEIGKDMENRWEQPLFTGHAVHLIHGVTGSGKTEVYMELIAHAIKKGKQAIVLIPEIALTFQTVMRFYRRFGDRVSIIHSRLSQGERYDQFERAKRGEIDIMIGPRSALFTPFHQLGLVIIDEEHESTYKSDSAPRYHARETAIARANMCNAIVVLGSATPSLESYYRARQGEYRLHVLNNRAGSAKLADVSIVDLREELKEGNKSILSRQLQEKIEERLKSGQQSILFINRRGYAGFVSCRSCGEPIHCPHCDVSLTVHTRLQCHYCGYSIPMPKKCPKCGSKYIAAFGTGTQKVEEVVKKRFPGARVLRMDMDTTKGKNGHQDILSAFANQEADILIGTQMIVKGHDFPNVTLVGVLAADLSLHAPDYRASERTFQLLTQAAGRAGRGELLGEVIIQTYAPEHYSIQTSSKQNYQAFYEQELAYRQLLNYPPISYMMVILVTSKEEEAAWQKIRQIEKELIRQGKNPEYENLQMIGPADASLSKINDIYRKIIYVKHEKYDTLVKIKNVIEQMTEELSTAVLQFDLSPIQGY